MGRGNGDGGRRGWDEGGSRGWGGVREGLVGGGAVRKPT